MNKVPVITIDGPTASGKGTIAHCIATHLGFEVLDSGALYRISALHALEQGITADDVVGLVRIASTLQVRFVGDAILSQESDLRIGDLMIHAPPSVTHQSERDISGLIRQEAVGNFASQIASTPAVRAALIDMQRQFAVLPGLVADGRDMGTTIFPDAPIKFFLTASAEARAQRRYEQLMNQGIAVKIEDLVADLQARDARDTQRSISPLKPAPDAILIDSTAMTVSQVVSEMMQSIQFVIV
jgi:cytidylate kinase